MKHKTDCIFDYIIVWGLIVYFYLKPTVLINIFKLVTDVTESKRHFFRYYSDFRLSVLLPAMSEEFRKYFSLILMLVLTWHHCLNIS
jgi:hypothetical protein